MTWVVLPDSGPLGKLIHPNPDLHQPASEFYHFLKEKGFLFLVPETVHDETQRKIEKSNFTYSDRQLRKFIKRKQFLELLPEDADLARLMEEKLKNIGEPITDPSRIPSPDGRLMGQAINLLKNSNHEKVIILTENYKDFIRLLKVCENQQKIDIWDYKDALTDLGNFKEQGWLKISLSSETVLC